MQSLNSLKLLLVISLSLTFFSCIKELEVKEVAYLNVVELNADKITLELGLKIENPNGFRIGATESDLDLFVGNKKLGKAYITENVIIPRKSEQVHKFYLEAKPDELFSGIGALLGGLFTQGTTSVTIKGYVIGRASFLKKRINVDVTEKIKL